MKNLYKILFVSALAVAATACSELNTTPVFEESESFAAFIKSSYGLNEDAGKVVIPVQIASISPVKTQVSYVINDGTAKKGVDYEDTNASAVLSFDGTTREQNIVINLIDRAGEYTGDLSFTVTLKSATGIKLSVESTCSVTIYDLDHPLASILGSYSAKATSSFDGDVSWTMNLLKDPKDITVVWINGITNELLRDDQLFYANVDFDEDGNIIGFTCPAGQIVPQSSSYDLWLVGNKAGSGSYYPNAPLSWSLQNGTFTFAGDEPNSIGILAVSHSDNSSIAGWWNRYDVPPSYTKN